MFHSGMRFQGLGIVQERAKKYGVLRRITNFSIYIYIYIYAAYAAFYVYMLNAAVSIYASVYIYMLQVVMRPTHCV